METDVCLPLFIATNVQKNAAINNYLKLGNLLSGSLSKGRNTIQCFGCGVL